MFTVQPNEKEKLLSRSVFNDTENTEATSQQTTIEDTTQEKSLETTTFAQETLIDTSEVPLKQTTSRDNMDSATELKTKEIKKGKQTF